MVLRNLLLKTAVAAVVAAGAVGFSSSASAQAFGYQDVSEDAVAGFVGAIPTSQPPIMVASDGEAAFDPFGVGFDVSDAIMLNADWGPDPAYASAFGPNGWQQVPDTFIWVLKACNDSGCENADIVEPIGKWDFLAGGQWAVGTLGLRIFDPNGEFSDLITVANDGPRGGATITFQSGTNNGAVPEPAAWTLMLIGFGGLGLALRSRRKVATA
jgi:hypothetical protein